MLSLFQLFQHGMQNDIQKCFLKKQKNLTNVRLFCCLRQISCPTSGTNPTDIYTILKTYLKIKFLCTKPSNSTFDMIAFVLCRRK